MSAHWVMLGLAAMVGWMGVVGAREVLRNAARQRLVPVRIRQQTRDSGRNTRY